MTAVVRAWAAIGLGANLNTPDRMLRQALDWLSALPNCQLAGQSRLYRSLAIGPGAQPDYANAVVIVTTSLNAEALLAALHALEARAGRTRTLRWGARTLDLDLLLYERHISHEPTLLLPHPRLSERDFVLQPLCDIAPGWRLPNGDTVATCYHRLGASPLPLWQDADWPDCHPLAIPSRLIEDSDRSTPIATEPA